MEVGAADPTERDPHQDFAICGLRIGVVGEDERVRFDMGGGWEDAGFHVMPTPTRVICEKRLQDAERKGDELFGEDKEAATVTEHET